MGLNEMDCLSAFDGAVFASLGKPSEFLGAACFPLEFVRSLEEMPVFLQFASFSVQDGIGVKERVEFGVMGTEKFLLDQSLDLWW